MTSSKDVQRLRNAIHCIHDAYQEWLAIYQNEQQQAIEKIKELEDEKMGS